MYVPLPIFLLMFVFPTQFLTRVNEAIAIIDGDNAK